MSRIALLSAAGLALASSAQAQLLTIALRPMAAAPADQQAASVLKGGAICVKQGPLSASEMRRAVTSNDSDTRLREALSGAGVMISTSGSAAVEVSGVARVTLAEACLPDFGFGKIDKITGKAEVAVEWSLTDRATGAEIGKLSTREAVERTAGTGGLAGLVDEAFTANAKALAANPAFRAAAGRPLLTSARPDTVQPRDPALLVLPPWRRVSDKTPLAIAAPRIVESDLDMQDAAAKIVILVTGPNNKYLAGTDIKNPERQLSVTAKTAGPHVVSLWAPSGPQIAPYRLKIDTDRRPYGGSTAPRAPSAPTTTAYAPTNGPIGPVALRWVVAAPPEAQAAGQIGAADFCTNKESVQPSEMRRAIESGALDARLRDDLRAAGFQVVGSMAKTPHGVAPVSLSAEARITSFQGCILNWGLANFDTVAGKVSMSVDWVARDRASGAELARLTTQQGVDRKKGSGGLLYLTQDAFSANIKTLLADPAVKAALRRPALANPKPDDGPARDPLRAVIPPWTPTAFGARIPLDLPKVAESDIDSTDEDKTSARETYRITVKAGETVSIAIGDTQKPLRVGVLDMQSTLITDTFGPSPALKWKAPAAGDYLIQVTSADKPRQTSYRMVVESDLRPKDPPKPVVAEAPKPSPEKPPAAETASPAKPPAPPALPPMPKFTPPPGVLLAEVGKSEQRPAGKVGAGVDLFAFIGEAGSVLQATAGAPAAGGHAITLYTPEGDEMLQADGVDQAKLSAVLPKDGVYMLAVGRQNAAKPYKLTLAADSPDLFQWSFRNLAGYEILAKDDGRVLYTTCWTAPGATLRYDFASGLRSSISVQRGGAGLWEFVGQPANAFTTQLAAGVFVRTYANGDPPNSWGLDDPPPRTGAYRGYFCK